MGLKTSKWVRATARVLGYVLIAFAWTLFSKHVLGESGESLRFTFVFVFCFLVALDASEAKENVKELRNGGPDKAIVCPYGYGLCHAFPLGDKPCGCEERETEQTAEDRARSGCGE